MPAQGTQGATADRLVLAGPGSAWGHVLGWLAVSAGTVPSLAADFGLHPPCH